MPRCLSEGVDIFLKSAERQDGANRTFATGGRCHGWQLEPCPCGLEPLYHFSIENSHLETRHQGVMFRSPWAFVGVTTALRYEPCTQFINVSQKTFRRCRLEFQKQKIPPGTVKSSGWYLTISKTSFSCHPWSLSP